MNSSMHLSDIAEINPITDIPQSGLVSFIGMEDVSEKFELLRTHQRVVSPGYTRFKEGDVLFAKITPCMENGKGAVALGLKTGFGIGSTEFHVIRPNTPESRGFIAQWLKSSHLRNAAEAQMTGSAGQRRVPTDFFKRFEVPKMSGSEQLLIAEILDAVDDQISLTERVISKQRAVNIGIARDALAGVSSLQRDKRQSAQDHRVSQGWTTDYLANLVTLPSGQVDPTRLPYADMTLVAPDHIEPRTGRLLERVTAKSQNAISGKYLFEAGDVVYSKIRPYLRKAILADDDGICSADMYPLRPGPKLNARYLLSLVLGEDFSRFAESVSMRTGIPKLNRGEFEEYVTTLPPKEDQDRIAEVLIATDKLLEVSQKELENLRSQKAGLMFDLLFGFVAVPSGKAF